MSVKIGPLGKRKYPTQSLLKGREADIVDSMTSSGTGASYWPRLDTDTV
ncbi:hypothetical protein [Rouxiella sp. S1S-2]|nr:hypothetical protein [Rouxiella sp. S1S-2]